MAKSLIYKDKAGNKLLRDPLTGVYEARNAKGGLVNPSGFKKLAHQAGMSGDFVKGKKRNGGGLF
jgi:hypothetical protein